MSDTPVPADLNGDPDTNSGRTERYDRVLPSFFLTNALTPVVMPSHTLPNGLVFVSANYVPLTDVPPVQYGDSTAASMQHMAVIKDFEISYYPTNGVTDPPAITTHPQSQTVTQGNNATFSVVASGTEPLNYQWRFNVANIAGATDSSYTRTNAQSADAGSYSVVVTNSADSVISSNAVLVVLAPPVITIQPQSQMATQGLDTTLTVTASGSEPLSYQWRFNTVNIDGTTVGAYTRSNFQPADVGSYLVMVMNSAGTASSSNAVLSLYVPRPVLTIQSPDIIRWRGLSNLDYTVQVRTNFESTNWQTVGTAASPTATVSFTNPASGDDQRFYRVIYP